MIPRVEDPAELFELFEPHKAVHIYGMADLEEPFWSTSTWYREGDAAVGVIPLPDSEVTAVYAVSSADPVGTLELLDQVMDEIPPGSLMTGPLGIADLFSGRRRIDPMGAHWKLVLERPEDLPDSSSVVTLDTSSESLASLEELHRSDPGSAFYVPSMVADGCFVAVRGEDGSLLASAGTHVVSDRFGVAAIGAVLTHPDHRRRGLGGIVTAGVCARLNFRAELIGLNVE